MKHSALFAFMLAATLSCAAQETVDHSSSREVVPYPVKNYFPGVCQQYAIIIRYDQSADANTYICDSSNNWNLISTAKPCTSTVTANCSVKTDGSGTLTVGTTVLDPVNGITTTPPSGQAGMISWPQGTAVAAPSNSVGFQAPTSVTSAFLFTLPGAPAAGFVRATNTTPSVLSVAPFPLSCQPGLGDGLNAIAVGTYLQSECYNSLGSTWTITGIRCYVDGGSSSTLAVTDAAGNNLLSAATLTCTNAFASGALSGTTTTIASGGYVKFTFIADGTAKQTTWVVSGTF